MCHHFTLHRPSGNVCESTQLAECSGVGGKKREERETFEYPFSKDKANVAESVCQVPLDRDNFQDLYDSLVTQGKKKKKTKK